MKFSINSDLIKNDDIFNSFCFYDIFDNLLVYDFFLSDFFNLVDYEKNQVVQEIGKISENPTTTLISKHNLLFQGTVRSEIAIYDIRSSDVVFKNQQVCKNNFFSPILKIETQNNKC